jgi:Type III restriction enzyme, res subunit
MVDEAEWRTRKRRVDPKLDVAGWPLRPRAGRLNQPYRSEEEETDKGPADYALWLDNHVVGVVEAKKLTLGPQNVLTQAQRYATGLRGRRYNFNGCGCPFLYATNGEIIWFQDVRHPLNRSRRIAGFHTSRALQELLTRDFDAACAAVQQLPHDHPRLRPYQKAANAAVEAAIAERKRQLLVAMATGTGKTFTLVNQIYRLMKAGVAKRVLFLVDRRALAAHAERVVAERAPDHLFVHAGVVGWDGRAIVMPGASFAGKTTLVQAWLESGATYYSDEFAVLDRAGNVHPFARPLAVRDGSTALTRRVPVAARGAETGTTPLPVGLVLVTSYQVGARWRPRRLTAAPTLLALMRHTVAARGNPKHSMPILKQAVSGGVAFAGLRGEARPLVSAVLRRGAI